MRPTAVQPISPVAPDLGHWVDLDPGGHIMGKTGRKRRSRRKKSANHGKRPNS